MSGPNRQRLSTAALWLGCLGAVVCLGVALYEWNYRQENPGSALSGVLIFLAIGGAAGCLGVAALALLLREEMTRAFVNVPVEPKLRDAVQFGERAEAPYDAPPTYERRSPLSSPAGTRAAAEAVADEGLPQIIAAIHGVEYRVPPEAGPRQPDDRPPSLDDPGDAVGRPSLGRRVVVIGAFTLIGYFAGGIPADILLAAAGAESPAAVGAVALLGAVIGGVMGSRTKLANLPG